MNLVVNDTSFSYKDYTIFDSINLMVSKGEFICLVGANGSGKSTLLRLIFGDIKPRSGEIFIEDSNKQKICLLYTSPSPRDGLLSRMPSSA